MREEIEINYTYFGFEMTYVLVEFQILQLCLTSYESWIWAKYNFKFLDDPNKWFGPIPEFQMKFHNPNRPLFHTDETIR